MKTANSPQNNSTVEVQPFTFFFPLTDRVILENRVQVQEIGALKVQGFAYRSHNPLGDPALKVDIQFVKHVGVDVKAVLTHFGHLEDIEAAALRHAERVVFAPKPTAASVLSAIIETVKGLREYEPLTLSTPIVIRLTDADHHLVCVEGLVVTHKGGLIVLDGSGNGHPLETTDVNAEKMIAGIYKALEKRFPNQIKAIV